MTSVVVPRVDGANEREKLRGILNADIWGVFGYCDACSCCSFLLCSLLLLDRILTEHADSCKQAMLRFVAMDVVAHYFMGALHIRFSPPPLQVRISLPLTLFYIAYISVVLPVTYAAFYEKVEAEPPRAERLPPTSTARETVEVDMPLFNYEEVEDGSREQCVICLCNYDEAEGPALSLPVCGHNFHVECVKRWLESHSRCPICSASPFPTHTAPFPPPARTDVVRVSVAIDAASTREYGNLTP